VRVYSIRGSMVTTYAACRIHCSMVTTQPLRTCDIDLA